MTSPTHVLCLNVSLKMITMLQISKQTKNEPSKPTKAKKSCITLRQWALLFSVVIFIISAVITTCSVLGNLHTRQLLEMLEEDIEEERYKHQFEFYDRPGLTLNEARLQRSQDSVLVYSKVLSICMWLSWLNLVFAAILIYGVASMTSSYMVPWIFTSGTTYLLGMTLVIMAFMDLIPGVDVGYTILVLALGSSLVFIEMWYTLVLYYINLGRGRCRSGFKVVQSYGGYSHTVRPLGGADTTATAPMV